MDARIVNESQKRLFDVVSRAICVQLPNNGVGQSHIAVHIPKDITDNEIDDLIRQILPKVMKSQVGCVCGVYGYDFDDRELYEIPEAIALAKRLVDLGFIAMAHTSTLMDKEEKPEIAKLFGAFEIWAMATGRLDANGDLDEEGRNVFLRDLDKANKRAGSIAFPTITDGQHRTKVR